MQESKYYMDLAAFTLEKLKNLLKNSRLLPSQQILQEDIKLWVNVVVQDVPQVIQYG